MWNGLSLQNEFSALLGDTSTSFKAKTLSWMNDIETDICSRHMWPFLLHKGQVKVETLAEEQNLSAKAPSSAPTIALAAAGSLTQGSVYKVKVAFYQGASGTETLS